MIIMMMALLLCDVNLVMYPLIVLMADQVSSVAPYTDEYGSVVVTNLEDQASSLSSSLDQLVCLVPGLSTDTTITVFLFESL